MSSDILLDKSTGMRLNMTSAASVNSMTAMPAITAGASGMPLVSIVIPVYNSSLYLRKCLDSVIHQTWENLDIICVNDGSTDDSLKILEEYSDRDRRIRLFTKGNEGRGAASARNMGLSKAKGKYIQFLDSDDFFETDMIRSLADKAEALDADIVICRGQTFDNESGRVIGSLAHPDLQYAPEFQPFSWEDCTEYICEIGDFYAWNKLYRRRLLIENGLNFTPIPISDDQDISMLSLVLAERIAVIDRPFINYRVGTGKSQCDSASRHPEAAYEGFYTVVKRLKELGVYDKVKHSYCNVAIRLMREYFDKMTEVGKARFLYDKYRDEVFPLLEAESLPLACFHDERVGSWYRLVTEHSFEEVLFLSARAGGGTMTTAPLRFQVPYAKIPRNGKIVLVGKGIAGRYWYSQLILSNYCRAVYWVKSEDEIPGGLEFDAVVKAY